MQLVNLVPLASFASLRHTLRRLKTLGRDTAFHRFGRVIILALELGAARTRRISANVRPSSLLSSSRNVVRLAQTLRLVDSRANYILIVVAASVLVGLGKLVLRTTLAFKLRPTSFSVGRQYGMDMNLLENQCKSLTGRGRPGRHLHSQECAYYILCSLPGPRHW